MRWKGKELKLLGGGVFFIYFFIFLKDPSGHLVRMADRLDLIHGLIQSLSQLNCNKSGHSSDAPVYFISARIYARQKSQIRCIIGQKKSCVMRWSSSSSRIYNWWEQDAAIFPKNSQKLQIYSTFSKTCQHLPFKIMPEICRTWNHHMSLSKFDYASVFHHLTWSQIPK